MVSGTDPESYRKYFKHVPFVTDVVANVTGFLVKKLIKKK